MDFATFVVQLNDAILFENGPNLAYLLRPTSPHGKDLVKEFRNPTVRPRRNYLVIAQLIERRCFSVLLLVVLKDAFCHLGTTLPFNTFWCAHMLQSGGILKHSRKNPSS